MQIYLAGYNLDAEIIRRIKEICPDLASSITPETISAAYARISRDPRPINELRKISSQEIEKTRKSNETIIFDMGHSSIAEHAVFNFDVIGLSRLAIEELENFRLASYTEKSQRYITLANDFIMPKEITNDDDIREFRRIIALQNNFYHAIYDDLKKYVFAKHRDLAENDKNARLLEGWAKEDARYISSLATEGQLGMTINARSLELMLRRLNASKLEEARSLGERFYNEVKNIAPSLVKYVQASSNDLNKYENLNKFLLDLKTNKDAIDGCEVKLLNFTNNADDLILASLLHRQSEISLQEILENVKSWTKERKLEIFKDSFQDLKFYDTMTREFEFVDFTFELEISAACFGQIKRHRMTSITTQAYNIDLGVKIPDSIVEVGFKDEFLKIIDETNRVYLKLKKNYGQKIAEYILTNAHKRKVFMKMNLRELYHFSRLREDAHAQWDIRNIAGKMTESVKKVAPISTFLLCGKDRFQELYAKIYGEKKC